MELENTIGITDLMAVIIRAWRQICALMLAFALLLGGYQAYRQLSLVNDPANTPEKIEERYQSDLENYETKMRNLQKTLENQEKSLASKEEYLEKSILLQIDPYNTYAATIVLAFTDIDESAQLFRYPNTAADYLPIKIRSQYMELWKSMDASRDIGIAKYADVEWKYLSEIVSVTSLEGELLSIQVIGSAESDVEELADAVYNYFEAHRDVIAAGSAQHRFAVVSRTTKTIIYEDLNTKRETLQKEIDSLKTAIKNSQQSIQDLKMPTPGEGYSPAAIAKSVVKYAVLGAAAGMFLGLFAVCCWWVFAGRAANSFQLEEIAGAPFLGSLRIPSGWPERLAVKVMGERSWRDQEQAASYIGRQANVHFPKDGTILLLSTLSEKKAGAQMDKLAEVLSQSGCQVSSVMDAVYNPQTVEALQGCAAVVLVERAEASGVMAVRNMVSQIKNAEKPVLGTITI